MLIIEIHTHCKHGRFDRSLILTGQPVVICQLQTDTCLNKFSQVIDLLNRC